MKTLLIATTLAALVASPAFAEPGKANPPSNPSPNGNAFGINGKVDAPLPLAAGLPALLLMGGAIALARRGRK